MILSEATLEILAERARQISAEGYSVEHDDQHLCGELASLAAAYAWCAVGDVPGVAGIWAEDIAPHGWRVKSTTPRRNLIKAGALIVAEIERLDRLAAAKEDAR